MPTKTFKSFHDSLTAYIANCMLSSCSSCLACRQLWILFHLRICSWTGHWWTVILRAGWECPLEYLAAPYVGFHFLYAGPPLIYNLIWESLLRRKNGGNVQLINKYTNFNNGEKYYTKFIVEQNRNFCNFLERAASRSLGNLRRNNSTALQSQCQRNC